MTNARSTTMEAVNTSGPGAVGAAPDRGQHLVGGAVMAQDTCSIDGCVASSRARGWCLMHWTRWRRHGSPTWEPASDLDRFMRFVEPCPGGCWEWKGAGYENGYGRFTVKSRNVLAHRWSYERHVGPIPPGLTIDHLCRNRSCVNPEHLEAVTSRENTLRSDNPAAMNARKTHCVRGHVLAGGNLRVSAEGYRVCVECRRLHSTGEALDG